MKRMSLTLGMAAAAAAMALAVPSVASADVTKDEAIDSWQQDLCDEDFFTVEIVDMAFGDFTGDGRADAAAVWLCRPPAGNLTMAGMTYWIDGRRVKQREIDLVLTGVSKVKIQYGNVKVVGSMFDPKPDQPYWMNPKKVKMTFAWNGKKLV